MARITILRLALFDPEVTVRVVAEHIVAWSQMKGVANTWTRIRMSDGTSIDVYDTPEYIENLLTSIKD